MMTADKSRTRLDEWLAIIWAGIKNDRISCSTACGTAHIRLHIREADMRRPLRISARGDTQLIVHFLKREREPK